MRFYGLLNTGYTRRLIDQPDRRRLQRIVAYKI